MKVLVVLLVAVAVGVHTAELHSRVLDVIAIGSCNRHDEDQSIWHRVIDEHPDLFVWCMYAFSVLLFLLLTLPLLLLLRSSSYSSS